VVSGAARAPDPEETGGGVAAPGNPEAPEAAERDPGVDPGIFGESFQGIPPLGLADVPGGGVFGIEENPPGRGPSGGNKVRAVSSGIGSRDTAGFASGLDVALISLPQPRQNL
jgi:hypothetical protein